MLRHILTQNSFWTINKKIAKELGLETALLLSDLISKYYYFKDNNMLTEDNYFFNTADNIEQDTTLTYHKQKKAIKILIEKGIVETKLIGLPSKLHFKIFESQVLNFLKPTIEKNSNVQLENFETNKNKENKNKENKNKYIPENEFSGEIFLHNNEEEKKRKKPARKKEKKTDPNFAPFRKLFETYYHRLTTSEYYWQVKDSVALNQIIKKVRHAYATATIPELDPSPEKMLAGFEAILRRAANDRWIRNNFETAIINSKFNNLKITGNGTQTESDRQKFGNVINEILRGY